jgi:4-aminobutyrate aminotransferase/(S)-3-amino-2-methylpropionate transaminase
MNSNTPSNAQLLTRREVAVPRGVATATPVFAARAKNAEIWDVEGKRYIDFAGGIAVLNTGHLHPAITAAVEVQIKAFSHTAFQVMAYEAYITLAERLNAVAPFKGPAKTILFTTGAEAVENAVKIARCATGRNGVVAFSGAFHGRSLYASALTGKVMPYKKGFGTLPGEVWHLPLPIAHYGVTIADTLRSLEMLFRCDTDPSQIAAIIIEPVQGEGGFHVAPTDLLVALRGLCDAHGIQLIADEVQAGFARTGKMFSIEHSGIEPDLVTMAKSLSGGFPLSGVLGRAELMDAVEPGGLGGTFGGSPIGCAAALAVLDVIDQEHLLSRAQVLGERMRTQFAAWTSRQDLVPIAAVRGLGAMLAFDIVNTRGGHEPDGAMAKVITTKARELGLVLLSCGIHGETLRFLMPLTIEDPVLEEGLKLLEKALTI